MHKQRYILLAALLAAGISQSFAQSTYPDTSARAKEFANQNKILQEESTSSPVGSPPVNRSARPADPIPKATTLQQKEARFKAMDSRLQRESTNLAAGSPRVDKSAAAADPYPKGTTKAQKAAAAAAEEKFLEKSSTR